MLQHLFYLQPFRVLSSYLPTTAEQNTVVSWLFCWSSTEKWFTSTWKAQISLPTHPNSMNFKWFQRIADSFLIFCVTPRSRRRLARCMCFVSRSAGARRDGPFDVWGKKRPQVEIHNWVNLNNLLVGDFKYSLLFFILTLTWARFPIWLLYIIFFTWVETPNQFSSDCKNKWWDFWNVAHLKLDSYTFYLWISRRT